MLSRLYHFKDDLSDNYDVFWEQRKLGDVSKRVQGNDGRMDLPTLTISAGNGWLDQRERFSGNIAGKEQKNYTLLSENELSYNKGNSKMSKYGVVFKLRTYKEALVPRVYHSFRTTRETDSDYIEYMFATKLPDRELGKLVTSGARMDGLLNINYEDFMGIKIEIPSLGEQRKIGVFFQEFDNLLTLHQRKLDALTRMKEGFLQCLFPSSNELAPKIRFVNFCESWEQREFNEVVDRISISSIDKSLPRIKYEDIMAGQGILNDDEILINDTNERGNKFKKNDILFGYLRPYLDNRLLATFSGIAVGDWWVLRHKNGNANFIFSLIQTQMFRSIANLSTGTKMPRANWKTVSTSNYYFPFDKREEIKVGMLFSQLDNLITLHMNKLKKLQKVKTAFFQKMFV